MDFIAGLIKALIAFIPLDLSGSTESDGVVIDRKGYENAAILLFTGAVSGAPDNVKLQYRVTHSDAANMAGETDLVALTTAIDAAPVASSMTEIAVNFEIAKRYVRFSVTPTFTAGTTPKVLTAAAIALGGAKTLPA